MSVDDAALWRSVTATLEHDIIPALPSGAERDLAVQLSGLARYALTRPPERPDDRAAQLSRALHARATTHDLLAVLAESARTLVAALEPGASPQLLARAAAVRQVLLDQLAQDVASVAPLLETFAGHPAVDHEPQPRALDEWELDALTKWFGQQLGSVARIAAASVISGGHSRRMLRVSVVDASDRAQNFVVRVEQGGTFGTDGTAEAKLMQALAAAGFPVAAVRWIEVDAGVLGHPFFVMDLVPGRSAVDDVVLDNFVRSLDALHRMDPSRVADALGSPPATPEAAVHAQLDHWLGLYRASVPAVVPLLEEAAEWLRRNLTPKGPVAVIHGDPGPGNFLVQDGEIRAVTDWEFGHYGDPAEDWAYLAIRGRKLKDPLVWRARFAELVGISYDESDWRAWEAFNSFKGACANLTALRLFREGTATTPNLLAIGTAVHFRFLQRLSELVGAGRAGATV